MGGGMGRIEGWLDAQDEGNGGLDDVAESGGEEGDEDPVPFEGLEEADECCTNCRDQALVFSDDDEGLFE